jgi:short-subunit dehydrogenase
MMVVIIANMMTVMNKPSVLVTGASTGIGAAYADRFAKRGHDLVLVARNHDRMNALADRLRAENGVAVDVIKADLTNDHDLQHVEARLRDDERIGILVNNAGSVSAGGYLDQNARDVTKVVNLNTLALTRLATAVAPRFAAAGDGAIINIASVVGLVPEYGSAVYGATKAYVLYLSQALHFELGPKGVYVQAVLPAATRTEIWDHAGKKADDQAGLMEVDELVNAALVGFDRRETVTIPTLPDIEQWNAFGAARQAMIPNLSQHHAAARYFVGAADRS